MKLRSTHFHCFRNFLKHLINAHRICIAISDVTVESAERTSRNADIRVIYVPVNHERNGISIPPVDGIRKLTEFVNVQCKKIFNIIRCPFLHL